jgi:hypothetical protein
MSTEKEYNSASRGPPLFKGNTYTRGPWLTFEFKFVAYAKGRKCAGPLTLDRPEEPLPNLLLAIQTRRTEEINNRDAQNDEAYGYLVQSMDENPDALVLLQLKAREDPIQSSGSCWNQSSRSPHNPAGQIPADERTGNRESSSDVVRDQTSTCRNTNPFD